MRKYKGEKVNEGELGTAGVISCLRQHDVGCNKSACTVCCLANSYRSVERCTFAKVH